MEEKKWHRQLKVALLWAFNIGYRTFTLLPVVVHFIDTSFHCRCFVVLNMKQHGLQKLSGMDMYFISKPCLGYFVKTFVLYINTMPLLWVMLMNTLWTIQYLVMCKSVWLCDSNKCKLTFLWCIKTIKVLTSPL